MEDIPPSPGESGILTRDPSSCWPTPQGTLDSVYTDDEELNYILDNPRKSYRNKLQTSSVTNLDEEPEDIPTGQIHYPSAPDISESMRRRNEQNHPEINDAGARREAPQEQQLLPDISGETGDNGEKKKKSFCHSSLKILKWLIAVCCCVIVFLVGVLLGCLLPRVAVKDLSSCGPPCDEPWIWVGGRCYYFSNASNTWDYSWDNCTKSNSMLAILIDQEIKKTIERYKENSEYWIGLSMNHNGQWMWINGSPYNASMDNHNNVSGLGCAVLNSHLVALKCSTSRQWICVKDSMYYPVTERDNGN